MNQETEFSAWNPGIESSIPAQYQQFETIFRPECVKTSIDEVAELAGQTGLKHEELVEFRIERLALHEVLIRVTADILVKEGELEEDLGINFRNIANILLDQYVLPELQSLESSYSKMQSAISDQTDHILSASLFTSAKVEKEKNVMAKVICNEKN